MAKKFLKQHEILTHKAKEDLLVSKYLLDGFHNHNLELNLDIIFFHFQQCAEKLIKAILDWHNIKFPHIHDIESLLKLTTSNNIILDDNTTKLIALTEYATDGRYAIIHDDLEDTDKYIDILDELLIFVQKEIA